MLRLLRIRCFAIIDQLELEFEPGFNVITGETGAGKSIILNAVGLILGDRGNSELIRTGSEEAVVEALFETGSNESLMRKLRSKGIDVDNSGGELLVKRVIQKNGKGRIFLNDELITLTQLLDISENLMDLCSQHEHQSLAKHHYQLEMIDRYGGLLERRREVRELFSALRSKQNELDRITGDQSDPSRIEDFLRFQLNEIDSFAPKNGEEEELITERRRILGTAHLLEACNQVSAIIGDSVNTDHGSSEGGVQTMLTKALKRMSKALELDDRLTAVAAPLQRALLEIEDSMGQLEEYLQVLQIDPERQEFVEDRLTRWAGIKKKYGSDFTAILKSREGIEGELTALTDRHETVVRLTAEVKGIKTEYLATAKTLSKQRKNIVKSLTGSVQSELNELKMPGTIFEVEFTSVEAEVSWSAEGIDRVQFLFAPNIGEGLKPIGKIASGGELSRVMLAIRRVIADKGGIGVYLFDEIDAGIGGQTATVVGKKLKSVSQFNQIICITHLPQIAAYAKAHFNVAKRVAAGRTFSEIKRLSQQARVEEISRMLGGVDVTGSSRAHAKELMKQATA